MNIFVTSKCPFASAANLDDKRVIKMVLESTQLLCTALRELGYQGTVPYKNSHVNHPCSLWVRSALGNYRWLMYHTQGLLQEYTKRYGKTHACQDVFDSLPRDVDNLFPSQEYTPFVNCASHQGYGLSFRHMTDVPLAYRMYLTERWKTDTRAPTWYGSPIKPEWKVMR